MNRYDRDVAALILRLAIGPMLVAHGLNKSLGGGRLGRTAKWFESVGLYPGWLHARLAAYTEITAGTLVAVGAFNPLPNVAVVGLMATAAATDHRGKGFFIFKGGWEYTAVVAAASTALAALGGGRWSLDHVIGKGHRSGVAAAAISAAAGLAGATTLLLACRPSAVLRAKSSSEATE